MITNYYSNNHTWTRKIRSYLKVRLGGYAPYTNCTRGVLPQRCLPSHNADAHKIKSSHQCRTSIFKILKKQRAEIITVSRWNRIYSLTLSCALVQSWKSDHYMLHFGLKWSPFCNNIQGYDRISIIIQARLLSVMILSVFLWNVLSIFSQLMKSFLLWRARLWRSYTDQNCYFGLLVHFVLMFCKYIAFSSLFTIALILKLRRNLTYKTSKICSLLISNLHTVADRPDLQHKWPIRGTVKTRTPD